MKKAVKTDLEHHYANAQVKELLSKACFLNY